MGIYKFQESDAFRFAKEIGAMANRKGTELRFVRCPYCLGGKNGKDKDTFSIDLHTGQFNCKRASCNAHGNMITLTKDFNFSLGNEIDEYYSPKKQFRNIHREKPPETRPAAIRYLEKRGISQKVAEQYNITVQKDNENILVFLFYDEKGILCFAKYRKMDFDKSKDKTKEWCESNCKPILFGMNHCNPENKTLVLTEGQIDSLSCTEAGIENAVSVPNGANGFTWIPYCWDFLSKFSTLIIFGDYENDAISLLAEMQKRFNGAVKHVKKEDYKGCKDANEILVKHGAGYLKQCVRNAIPVQNPKIKPLENVERIDISKLEHTTTGFAELDKLIGGFYMGQLIILTGQRGEGKSTLASQFGTFAVANGYTTFFYSGELLNWHFKSWFEHQAVGAKNINPIVTERGYTAYSVKGEIISRLEKWYSGKAYIYDNTILEDSPEEETLLQTLENAIKQYDCRVLMIDNLMTAITDDISSDLYRQQTAFVRKLSLMAKKFNVLIFLIAHPRKSSGKTFDNDDISGSANITNLADVVIRYSRPDDNPANADKRVLTVIKNRLTGRTNRTGMELYYQEMSKRISENEFDFDWELGWENDNKDDEFRAVTDYDEIPF